MKLNSDAPFIVLKTKADVDRNLEVGRTNFEVNQR